MDPGATDINQRLLVSRRLKKVSGILLAMLWLAALLALYLGYKRIGFADFLRDTEVASVFWRLRFPRVLLAAIVGASLSITGAALQALFHNPLAEPFTLGVSGGATL